MPGIPTSPVGEIIRARGDAKGGGYKESLEPLSGQTLHLGAGRWTTDFVSSSPEEQDSSNSTEGTTGSAHLVIHLS